MAGTLLTHRHVMCVQDGDAWDFMAVEKETLDIVRPFGVEVARLPGSVTALWLGASDRLSDGSSPCVPGVSRLPPPHDHIVVRAIVHRRSQIEGVEPWAPGIMTRMG